MPDFGTPFTGLANDRKLTKEELIRAVRFTIAAEYEAVQMYMQLAESIDDESAAKLLRKIADEERVHVGELMKLVKKLDPEEEKFYTDGEKEAEDILGQSSKTSSESFQPVIDYV
jgi:rubrerythrin